MARIRRAEIEGFATIIFALTALLRRWLDILFYAEKLDIE